MNTSHKIGAVKEIAGPPRILKVLLSPASVNYDKAMRDSMMQLVTRALPTKTKDLCVQVCAHESIPYTFQQTL